MAKIAIYKRDIMNMKKGLLKRLAVIMVILF